MDKLKPCKCGSQNLFRVRHIDSRYNVHCKSCGYDGPFKYSEQEAIKAWNTRKG